VELAPVPQPRPEPVAEPGLVKPVQQPLFSAREMAGAIPASQASRSRVLSAKIVSMDGYVHPTAEPSKPNTPRARRMTGQDPRTDQQHLNFVASTARVIPANAPPARCCNAPVALPMHRFIAGFLDYSMISIAFALLLLPLLVSPAGMLLTMETLPVIAAAALVTGFGYKLLWALAGTESPGMRWAALRVLHFDGIKPSRRQRLLRVLSGALSLASAGLGLLWVLADEETLSWHDHISKTFVTPHTRG